MWAQFGEYSLDTESLELTNSGKPVEIEPQVFSLLVCLIENRDRVVSKDEIIEMVWDGRIVSDSSLNTRINSLRKAVGDDGKSQAVIKTFPRRGFRWVAELEGEKVTAGQPKTQNDISDKPSIAVLPFENLSNDPEQEYFSDGITEDIITALSRIRQLFVIARNTTFVYKGQVSDMHSLAQDLGVRYILEGSVRKSGTRVRITAQLVDGESGVQIWAEKYDRELEDIFIVQDEITQLVVGTLGPTVTKAEMERARKKPTQNLDAWEIYQQGLYHLNRRSVEDLDKSEELFLQAIELSPELSPAHSGLAYAYAFKSIIASIDETDELCALGLEAANKAVEYDPDDDLAHSALARALHFSGNLMEALREYELGLKLNPSSAFCHYGYGRALIATDDPVSGISYIEQALHLSPYDMWISPFYVSLAEGYFFTKQYENAIEWLDKAIKQPNVVYTPFVIKAAALGHLGSIEAANAVYNEAKSRFSAGIDGWPFHFRRFYGAKSDRIEEGLRKAGVPEE